jgi:thiol:disulfide interchange protein DsbD
MIFKILVASVSLFLSPVHAAQSQEQEELLEPDQAFQLSTRVIDTTTLEASWQIAPGYYLYRDKFKFEPLDGTRIDSPIFPRGKKKQDPLFGEVETYTKSVKIRVPYTRQQGLQTAQLRITAQGCNEPVGVCYPPIVKEVVFKLPPATGAGARAAGSSIAPVVEISSLSDFTRGPALMSGAVEPVDPEKAFIVSVSAPGGSNLLARFDVDECCYLYRDKTSFELAAVDGGAAPAGIRLEPYSLPPGKTKTDEFFGETEVYYTGIEVRLTVAGLAAPASNLQLKVNYQGCSEKGVVICYPPTTKTFGIQSRGGVLAVVAGPAAASFSSMIGGQRDQRGLILSVLAAFVGGLLLTFTPCVLPMIPILSGVIVGQDNTHLSKLRGGLLSYSYVFGTAVTYTVAGFFAGYSGDQLQAYFQNPWAIGAFSALLIVLALSLFGFYELQMPHFIQSHLHRRTHHLKGGSILGVLVLGMISALIIGACVSPVLISALGAAIASKDPVLGGAIMFALAHGQGVILIALGIGAGFLLPKVGKWMDRVKHLFGVLLIAVAIYLLGYLPEVPVLFLWSALFIISAVYLGAVQSLPQNASGWRYLWKGVGLFLLIWGVLALVGGFAGSRDIFSPLPLSALSSNTGMTLPSQEGRLFERVSTVRTLEDRLTAAKAARKPVILDYYADWCTDCLRMENSTFADPGVRAELRNRFVLLQADVTDPNDPEGKAIKRRFGVYGPPAMLFFAPDGAERRDLRTYGFRNVDEFLNLLRKI